MEKKNDYGNIDQDICVYQHIHMFLEECHFTKGQCGCNPQAGLHIGHLRSTDTTKYIEPSQ